MGRVCEARGQRDRAVIPVKVDVEGILADFARIGWSEYRVEKTCALPKGWLYKARTGVTADPGYSKLARIYNLWEDIFKKGVGESCVPAVQISARRYVDGALVQVTATWADVLRIGYSNGTT